MYIYSIILIDCIGGTFLQEYAVVIVIVSLLLLSLLIFAPKHVMKWTWKAASKLTIGACCLFLLNVGLNRYGINLPINIITTSISGFLGIPGVAAVAVIQLYIL